jgi:hypothetical protein
MSSTVYNLPLKMRATSAAADTNCTAVALTELPAAFVSFRWQQPSLPPTQNVNSAPCSLTSACYFGGKFAKFAVIALTSAIFATFADGLLYFYINLEPMGAIVG